VEVIPAIGGKEQGEYTVANGGFPAQGLLDQLANRALRGLCGDVSASDPGREHLHLGCST
jgi:hypothetical protein